jgi:hypothetical protein
MDVTTKHLPALPSLIRFVAPAVAASLLAVSTASAQAWVPPKNSGVFDFTYARATADKHLFSETVTIDETGQSGKSVYYGYEYSNIFTVGVDYGITDRLAVRANLAYVASKYNGLPAWQETVLDDGTYHGTLTDFAMEVRYMAVEKNSFVFTPFLGFIIPIGFGFGYTWPRQIHTTYFQARYAYAYLETNGFTFARSNAFVEAGTYLARWCSIRGLIGGERTHGGIDWATDIDTDEEWENHDARTSSRYWSAGLGVTFIVTPAVSLSASYSEILGGANVVDTKSFWVSTTWYFGGAGSKLIGKSK